ncbi:MAG TPA: preprotein translocase subunit YajC [Firmicutes bacterium]|nr:preprotein translocase subunit YajC [Bacillota bacterium]
MENLGMFLPIVIFFGVMYLFVIRPQSQQQKKRKEMLDSLQEGAKIRTIGGFYGTVEKIKDDELTVRIAENVRVKMARFAVESIIE